MEQAFRTAAELQKTDKFHRLMSSLGFELSNHGVAAIVTNHQATAVTLLLFLCCARPDQSGS